MYTGNAWLYYGLGARLIPTPLIPSSFLTYHIAAPRCYSCLCHTVYVYYITLCVNCQHVCLLLLCHIGQTVARCIVYMRDKNSIYHT